MKKTLLIGDGMTLLHHKKPGQANRADRVSGEPLPTPLPPTDAPLSRCRRYEHRESVGAVLKHKKSPAVSRQAFLIILSCQ